MDVQIEGTTCALMTGEPISDPILTGEDLRDTECSVGGHPCYSLTCQATAGKRQPTLDKRDLTLSFNASLSAKSSLH